MMTSASIVGFWLKGILSLNPQFPLVRTAWECYRASFVQPTNGAEESPWFLYATRILLRSPRILPLP